MSRDQSKVNHCPLLSSLSSASRRCGLMLCLVAFKDNDYAENDVRLDRMQQCRRDFKVTTMNYGE